MRYITGVATLLLLARASAASNQHFLNLPQKFDPGPPSTGQLWRFDVAEDPNALSRVLSLSEEYDLDLWQLAHSHIDIYAPASAPALPAALREIRHSLVANISAPELPTKRTLPLDWDLSSLANTTFHEEYHPLFEIEAFMKDLVDLHPDLIELKKLGLSGTGREMTSLKISKGKGGDSQAGLNSGKRVYRHPLPKGKLAVVILGAQHAREWIATATALYLAHALVSKEKESHSLKSLLDTYDFYIVPVPNPDGYDYTWESDRFWYKTRQRMGNQNRCFGLDMNRNWGYKWKSAPHEGIPNRFKPREPVDPCSHWYPGHHAFEAPEVNNIANMVITIPHLVGFIDLRSYGQMLSTPFSYSCERMPPDAENLIEGALGAAQAMTLTHGTEISTGRLCEMLYSAPGNVVDWMYKRAGIEYSYVLHLRDTGTYGFSLPSRWIRPVGEETSELIRYLCKFMVKKWKRPF